MLLVLPGTRHKEGGMTLLVFIESDLRCMQSKEGEAKAVYLI